MAEKRMLMVLLLTTRDEAELLRQNLEHHLGWGVDHVGVCDNRSRDHTQEVLASFGGSVTSVVFDDFGRRQTFRMRCLQLITDKLGQRPDWIGVADTDEFFWAPHASLGELLDSVPPEIVAATSRQKLFVPTEADPESGPVYSRMLYRTVNDDSPYHRSYPEGKTFYRGTWLRRITSEHRCREVPHNEWTWSVPLVHHYMITDEDHFVKKVSRLPAWRSHSRLKRSALLDRLYRGITGRPQTPFVSDFKLEWWRVFAERGEEGLRSYYRSQFWVSRTDLQNAIQAGHLVLDHEFADYKTGSTGAESAK